jgi:hypothetical protein
MSVGKKVECRSDSPDGAVMPTKGRMSAGIYASFAFVTVAYAGGTIGLEEVFPLLRQKPALAEFVFSTLEVRDSGWAAVRIGSHHKHLGGMGPYSFAARRKGSSGGFDLEFVICTRPAFLDRDGQPRPRW